MQLLSPSNNQAIFVIDEMADSKAADNKPMAAGYTETPEYYKESTSVSSAPFVLSPFKRKEWQTGRNATRFTYETMQKSLKNVKPKNRTAVRQCESSGSSDSDRDKADDDSIYNSEEDEYKEEDQEIR